MEQPYTLNNAQSIQIQMKLKIKESKGGFKKKTNTIRIERRKFADKNIE